jgi:NAD(P)H-flavin reductase
MNDNPMLPYLGKLVEVRDLAAEIKLFRIVLQNGGSEAFRTFQPGQFAFISAFGVGEAPWFCDHWPA